MASSTVATLVGGRLTGPDPHAVDACLQAHDAVNGKLLFHSHGQLQRDDLHTMAWLCAHELALELQRALDLTDEADAALLMQRLRRDIGRLTRASTRENSFDQSFSQDEDNPFGWSAKLAHDDGAHPLSLLEEIETSSGQPAPIEIPDAYHSESAAWHWLAMRFEHRTREIARYLLISASWCRQRRRRALASLKRQCQLPHALEVGDDERALRPWRGFKLPGKTEPPDAWQPELQLLQRPSLTMARQPALL